MTTSRTSNEVPGPATCRAKAREPRGFSGDPVDRSRDFDGVGFRPPDAAEADHLATVQQAVAFRLRRAPSMDPVLVDVALSVTTSPLRVLGKLLQEVVEVAGVNSADEPESGSKLCDEAGAAQENSRHGRGRIIDTEPRYLTR